MIMLVVVVSAVAMLVMAAFALVTISVAATEARRWQAHQRNDDGQTRQHNNNKYSGVIKQGDRGGECVTRALATATANVAIVSLAVDGSDG